MSALPIVPKVLRPHIVEINPMPLKPDKSKNYDINPILASAWIHGFDEEYHEAFGEMVSKIRRISFAEFGAALGGCVLSLPKPLNGRAAILVSQLKSNQWVAEIAAVYFKFTGNYLSLGHDDASDYVALLAKIPVKQWPTDVVLFDDASYSGNQITRHVTAIVNAMKAGGASGTIHVAIPFITSVALEKLSAINLGANIRLNIATHQPLQTTQEVMTQANYPKLAEAFPAQLHLENDTGIGLTYFDHKVPNGSSFLLYALGLLPAISPPYIDVAKKSHSKSNSDEKKEVGKKK